MNTCETCKWWNNIDYWGKEIPPPELNDETIRWPDRPPPAPGRWGWCTKVAEFGPNSPADRFYVNDGSQYHADLNTRHDFGCVEWENQ